MKLLLRVFLVLGSLACLMAGLYVGSIGNPILAAGAIVLAVVATGFAVRYLSTHVILPNLERAKTQPTLRSGSLYWVLRVGLACFVLGFTGVLAVTRRLAETYDPAVYYGVAGGLLVAGIGLMAFAILAFKAANRP